VIAGAHSLSHRWWFRQEAEHARGKLEMISEVLQELAVKLKRAHEHGLRSATLNLKTCGGFAGELGCGTRRTDPRN
jgi:hypothetical protein